MNTIRRDQWLVDIKAPVLKAGRKDETENLRPITLVPRGFENTEATLQAVTEESVEFDVEQSGFTKGAGAVCRVFILRTLIFSWLRVAREETCAVFLDLASFFDMISAP